MRTQYIVAPNPQVGKVLSALLEHDPVPTAVVVVSAFANHKTALRLRDTIIALRDRGTAVRVVLGTDMDGTSKEALDEVLGWGVEARLVRNRRRGQTFHPKVYVVERRDRADVLIGSSNFTDGGFFRNVEGVAHVTYDLPVDGSVYQLAKTQLSRLLDPCGATVRPLTQDLIDCLVRRGDVLPEAKVRAERRAARKARPSRGSTADGDESPFGSEPVPEAPALPAHILAELVNAVDTQRKAATRQRTRRGVRKDVVVVKPAVELHPTAFFIELPPTREKPGAAHKIPGESRIPYPTRDLAPDFWGWPDEYTKAVGSSGRTYMNWRPVWRISDSQTPEQQHHDPVRMYDYADSSDFRFYASRLRMLGADAGDIVRITRVSEPDAEFECVLARRGTPAYNQWKPLCQQKVKRNSLRHWGYT